MPDTYLLEAENLVKHFQRPGSALIRSKQPPVIAVNGLSLGLKRRETLALVGESGCGKSTTARMLLDLERPTSGVIRYESVALHEANRAQRLKYRSSVQAVFQDPWSSLNPRMRVRQLISEPLRLNGVSAREAEKAVAQALDDVGLEQAVANNFPHEFSGGQRQRIAIARAIAVRPKVIVLDEPVSALDVSVRAQIMNLLKDLQESLGMSYLLISHDLATVRYLANRVAVMHRGSIVEEADAETLFTQPQHPYTDTLISAARIVRPTQSATYAATAPADHP